MKNVNSIVSLLFISTFVVFVQVFAQDITNTPEQQSAIELDSNATSALEERDSVNTDVVVPEIKQDDASQNEQSTFLIGNFISYVVTSIIVYGMCFLGIHFAMHIYPPVAGLILLLILSCIVLSCIQFSTGYYLYAIGNIVAFLISATLYIISICFCPL